MIRGNRLLVVVLMTSAAPLRAAPAAQERPSPPGTPVVKLISAGAEPRRKLRYELSGEVDEKVQSTVQTTMTLNGQPAPGVPAHTVRTMVSRIHAKPDASAELISFEYKVESCTGDPPSGAATATPKPAEIALCTGVGSSTGGVWTTRGILLEGAVHVDPSAPPQVASAMDSISQSFRQLAAPLPAEPVGVGAEWEVSARMPLSGTPVDVTMTSHYKVLEVGRSRLVTEMIISTRLHPRSTEAAGTDLHRLSAMSTEGRGRIEIDLTHMVLVGDMQMTTRMEMPSPRVGDAGVKGPMVLETTVATSTTRL